MSERARIIAAGNVAGNTEFIVEVEHGGTTEQVRQSRGGTTHKDWSKPDQQLYDVIDGAFRAVLGGFQQLTPPHIEARITEEPIPVAWKGVWFPFDELVG